MGELVTQTHLAPDQIGVRQRLRPVSEAGVTSLMDSIRQAGVMKDDIHVRVVTRKSAKGPDDTYWLIAGAHRLEAARRLEWEKVPVKIWRCSDDWARLLEIDDNLAHAELSPLELATFLAERKRVHLRLYPQTARGAAGAAARWDNANGTRAAGIEGSGSFAKTVADKRDLSERHVQKLIQIGERLSATQVAALQTLPKAPSLRELLALAKMEGASRDAVLAQLSGSVSETLKAAEPAKAEGVDSPEKDFRSLQTAWSRAGTVARRRFLDWAATEIAILSDAGA